MFSKKQLYRLIIPLIIEQILAVTVGMVDLIMVSSVGEIAVSGVSLVDTLNVLLINIFSALATGGAVVSAQYLGNRQKDKACESASQLLLSSSVVSVVIMVVSLIGNAAILQLIYGNIDLGVMNNARLYFYITAFSFPFLAIYNACAALFRAMGNSKASMLVSLIMNLVNVIGNAILVYGFHRGVEGVAIPTLISRVVAAVIMLVLIKNPEYPIHIKSILHLGYDKKMIKKILNIGVPNGLENGIFQIGKILVQGLIASFGTIAIAGNAVGNTVAGIAIIPGAALSLAMVTVVGQCVGANDYKQAKSYTIKLMKIAYLFMFLINIIIIIFSKSIVGVFGLSTQATELALQLTIYHSIVSMILWPVSFTLPSALRASNDVKFTMIVAIISMWLWRIGFSYVLGSVFGLGVLGVWIAMTLDWLFRSTCFVVRFIKGKWKLHAFVS